MVCTCGKCSRRTVWYSYGWFKNKVAVAAFLLSVQIILYFELTLSKILKYYVF
ncbi:unnamed protein product [Tenebrio molitor]|nr:unnamed protein product [Tenebrio molitor]